MNRIQFTLIWIAANFLTFWLVNSSVSAFDQVPQKIDSILREGNEIFLKNPKEAIEIGLSAAELAENAGDYKKLLEAYSLLRNSYFYHGLMEEASYYSIKNFQIAEESGTEQELLFAKINLGGIWLMLGKYDKAKELFYDAIYQMDEQPAQVSDSLYAATMAVILNNLSLCEANLSQWEKAKEHVERGIEIAEENTKIPHENIRLLNNYSDILQNLNRIEEAKRVLNNALEISKAIKSPILEATTYYSLTRLSFNIGDLEKAVLASMRSFKIAEENENISIEGGLAALMYEEYKKLNMPDSALKYRRIQEKVDSLSKFNSANEFMLKEELQRQFNKTLENSRQKETKQKITFILLLTISFVIIAVLAYFFNKALKKAKQFNLDKQKSQEIASQIAEEVEILESVLKEKSAELSAQSLKKLEKDKKIEELLQKLLSSETYPSEKRIDIKKELTSIKNENALKEFDLIFSEVHSGFLARLQGDFPALTLNERRMCAMLKLQLTSKEISQITHQSVRSIEITRTRLRKKLNLTNRTTRISDFLSSY